MKGGDMWKWMQEFEKGVVSGKEKGKTIDWEERKQRVKDAFLVSWEGYEQDAWGKWQCTSMKFAFLTMSPRSMADSACRKGYI